MSNAPRSTSLGGSLALRKLEEYLAPDEEVVCLASARSHGHGVLAVLTSRRILLVHGGVIRKGNFDIALSQVSAVTHSSGLLFAKITVHSSGGREEIEQIQKADTKAFVELARERVGPNAARVSQAGTLASSAGPVDVMAQLSQLGELRKAGVLTEAEFESKKQTLLERL